MPTAGTGLAAGIELIYLDELYTVSLTFILDLSDKFVPALFTDCLGKMLVLYHAGDVEIFHDDSIWK